MEIWHECSTVVLMCRTAKRPIKRVFPQFFNSRELKRPVRPATVLPTLDTQTGISKPTISCCALAAILAKGTKFCVRPFHVAG